ncbi:glyoxalase/bleomycin resistance/extradiol dioxygenase family protein [Leptobacterium flavescens]|uniref:Glyoxalase/bleomycin resistance/extradiol dioxygenase family protein n=1 Tax=Leptobacterium flavescens TaxID=472055 RepID=A0A6P0USG1_9FLAO|nr:glyoxalase superfamily protein [Leptobacterium flavescens]NER15482.1 glyoxalase/bleomycin resistance/extradiol dioxygenase family protein [Leptobacterium flavescens]
MEKARGYFQEIHPVLPVQDVVTALRFYVEKLGFNVAFADDEKEPTYAAVKRDNIEIHLQWHDAKEWEVAVDRPMLRFVVQNIEGLFDEYKDKDVFHERTALKETPWGTREFAFYDPYKNGLTFYHDL